MAESATKRYFEEILEVTGVGKRGVERLEEIRNMPESELKSFAEGLQSRIQSHYQRNIVKIVESLRRYEEQPKAFYFGGFPIQTAVKEAPFDWFVRKTALYYGKVVIADSLEAASVLRDAFATEGLRIAITSDLASLLVLWPWAEAGLIEALPVVSTWTKSLRQTVYNLADEDLKDEEWASSDGALKDEDKGLEGEALIQDCERRVQNTMSQKRIDEGGGLRNSAFGVLLENRSREIGSGFFGSALTDSSPTTDLRQPYRLFGLWSQKRAGLLVQRGLLDERTWMKMREETKAGRVWQGLKLERLGALMNLPPDQIIKVRDDSRYSFRSFREELGEKVEEMEMAKLGDEKEIQQVVSQVEEHLNREAESVEKDRKYLRLKFGVSAVLTPLSLILSLLPFPLSELAKLIGGASLMRTIDYGLDMQRQKERSGYFLVRLQEEAEDQEVRRRRRDI